MPIYDYRCDHCGHAFSARQAFSDAALEKCPSCGGKPRRTVSASAIVFKGSGWYKTDSRSAPASAGEKSDKSEKADKSDKAEKADKADKADKAEKADKGDKKDAAAPAKSATSGEAAS